MKVHPRPVVHRFVPAGLAAWLRAPETRKILGCESHDNPTDVSTHNGVVYYGEFQANRGFWLTYGGDPRYFVLARVGGHSLFMAPKTMQDQVAYRGYLARGYEPWSCR